MFNIDNNMEEIKKHEDFISKVTPHTDKLVIYMKNNGIDFSPTDGKLANVIFHNKEKTVKISHHSFYGISRMGAVRKDLEGTQFEFVPVTHEMFIGGVMKSILDSHFNIGKNKK